MMKTNKRSEVCPFVSLRRAQDTSTEYLGPNHRNDLPLLRHNIARDLLVLI